METEEIIKGLRFCAGTDCHCEECPYADTQERICIDNLFFDVANEIESQQTRIADLEKQLSESQRREKAAVEDIELILRCNQNCGLCEFNGGAEQCETANGVCQAKWRGPQDEKGL